MAHYEINERLSNGSVITSVESVPGTDGRKLNIFTTAPDDISSILSKEGIANIVDAGVIHTGMNDVYKITTDREYLKQILDTLVENGLSSSTRGVIFQGEGLLWVGDYPEVISGVEHYIIPFTIAGIATVHRFSQSATGLSIITDNPEAVSNFLENHSVGLDAAASDKLEIKEGRVVAPLALLPSIMQTFVHYGMDETRANEIAWTRGVVPTHRTPGPSY